MSGPRKGAFLLDEIKTDDTTPIKQTINSIQRSSGRSGRKAISLKIPRAQAPPLKSTFS